MKYTINQTGTEITIDNATVRFILAYEDFTWSLVGGTDQIDSIADRLARQGVKPFELVKLVSEAIAEAAQTQRQYQLRRDGIRDYLQNAFGEESK